MKKILIVSHWMEIGGAERSLLGLLNSIDYTEYSVDLFLCRHTGEFMEFIPKEVNLLPEDEKAASIAVPIKSVIKNKHYDIFLGRCISKIATKYYNLMNKEDGINTVEIEYSNKYTYKFIKNINPHICYDLAISFLEPHYIVANKVNARNKVAWMHTDYSSINVDVKEGYKIWNKYDHIVSISDECRKSFISKYPNLKKKIILVENIISETLIRQQSNAFNIENEIKRESGEIVLLSIGRFCEAKNFDNIPNIVKRLLNKNIKVKWYIIGFGAYENIIKSKIIEENVEDEVVILGKKVNPYPYIKECDIYIQPSRYEGKAVSVREAQVLNKPVIITNFPTASSQLIDGFDGIICPSDNEGCANAIADLINNEEMKKTLIYNTTINNYTNKNEIEKIYMLINKNI